MPDTTTDKAKPSHKLLTLAEACDYIGIHRNTLLKLKEKGLAPHTVQVNDRVRYRLSDLDAWLAALPEGPAHTKKPQEAA
jgi:excisionase family DNA binding protein